MKRAVFESYHQQMEKGEIRRQVADQDQLELVSSPLADEF